MEFQQTIISVAATIVGAYMLLLLFMYFFQHKLFFLPSSDFIITPQEAGLVAEDLWIETEDDERLHGWFFPVEDSENVVVLSHGNAGNISHRIDIAKFLQEAGVSVLLYDYRGYGQSTGTPSETGMYRDIEGVINFLKKEKGCSEQQMVLYGKSMGGPVASYAAAKFNVSGLILDSTFENVKSMVQDLYPIIPSFLASYEFPTAEYVKKLVEIPVVIMHSPNDSIVDISHGRALYAIANEPKSFVELRGGHNDNFHASVDIHNDFWRKFLKQIKIDKAPITDG